MKTKHFYIVITLFFFFFGCEKDESLLKNAEEGKIVTIKNSEQHVIAEFTWKNGLLVESWHEEDSFSPGEKAEFTYTYDEHNRLVRTSGYQPGIIYMSSITGAMGKNVNTTYLYDQQDRIKEIRRDYDYPKREDVNFSMLQQFEYPEDGVVHVINHYVHPDALSVPSYTDYFFNSDSNIERMDVYSLSGENKTTSYIEEYTYDKYKAPYNTEPGPGSKNNITRKVQTAYNYDEAGNQSVAYTSTFTYEYTYNALSFPVSQTETYPNEIVFTKYFSYKK